MTAPSRFKPGIPASVKPDAAEIRGFVGGATGKQNYPWNAHNVRHDLLVECNSRQPEDVMLKIRWLAVQEERPIREVIKEALEDYFEKAAKRFGVAV